MRLLALALVWLVAIAGAFAALISAYVGRADFGDGRGASMSVPEAAALVVLAVAVLAVAGWLTRRLMR